MAHKIIIQYQETDPDQLQWIKIDDDGLRLEAGFLNTRQLVDKYEQWHQQEVYIIVPGSQCLSLEAMIPAKSPRQIRTAFPFSVEEHLSEPIEQLHFAIGAKNKRNQVTAIVTSNALIERWLKPFKEAKITPKLMASSHQLITHLEECHHLFVQNDMASLIAPDEQTFSCELELLEMVLHPPENDREESDEENQKPKILIESADAIDPELVESLSDQWQVQQLTIEDNLLYLARNISDKKITNLLQDKFKVKAESNKLWETWQMPAYAAGLALMLQLLSWSVDYWQLSHQKQAIKQAQLQVYKSVFPRQKRISNPVRLMRSQLKQFKTAVVSSNFLPLMEKYTQAIDSVSITQLTSVVFRSKKGEINISYVAPDLATIEKFQEALKKLQLEVKPGASNKIDNGYSGQMTIKERS